MVARTYYADKIESLNTSQMRKGPGKRRIIYTNARQGNQWQCSLVVEPCISSVIGHTHLANRPHFENIQKRRESFHLFPSFVNLFATPRTCSTTTWSRYQNVRLRDGGEKRWWWGRARLCQLQLQHRHSKNHNAINSATFPSLIYLLKLLEARSNILYRI